MLRINIEGTYIADLTLWWLFTSWMAQFIAVGMYKNIVNSSSLSSCLNVQILIDLSSRSSTYLYVEFISIKAIYLLCVNEDVQCILLNHCCYVYYHCFEKAVRFCI